MPQASANTSQDAETDLRISRRSIYGMMYRCRGIGMFVRPGRWTDEHSTFLGADWEDSGECDQPQPKCEPGAPPSNGHLRPSKAINLLMDELTKILNANTARIPLSYNEVETVLSVLWSTDTPLLDDNSGLSESNGIPEPSKTIAVVRDELANILRSDAVHTPLEPESAKTVLSILWPPADTVLPENIPGKLKDGLAQVLNSAAVHTILSSNAVKTVLSTLWPAAFSCSHLLPTLDIFFDNWVYRDAVETQVMWGFPEDSAQRMQSSSISGQPTESPVAGSNSLSTTHNRAGCPMMCYIGKNHLDAMRANSYRIRPGSPNISENGPVSRLRQLQSKALKPRNSYHDANFVAIFLAMAQRHFYSKPAPSSRRNSKWSSSREAMSRPAFASIVLRILTHDDAQSEFIVYTGYVTSGFLDRFHDPFSVPKSGKGKDSAAGIKITYKKVPIWPILGLKERLGKAFGEDIVGPIDLNSSEMETWESDTEGLGVKSGKHEGNPPDGSMRASTKKRTMMGKSHESKRRRFRRKYTIQ